jgi:2-polyprenyl-6-methoxyphenol hydroxylase-like FAD-dependent oxidoreductase
MSAIRNKAEASHHAIKTALVSAVQRRQSLVSAASEAIAADGFGMTPYRGIGANVVLRDARLLCANLVVALKGECTIEGAVRDYEKKMRDYGFAAVRTSLKAMQQAIVNKGIAFRFTKLAFRAINTFPPLKRAFLANFGRD